MELNAKTIRELIEASVEQLLAYDLAEALPPPLEFYRQALLAFHRGSVAGLEKMVTTLHERQPVWLEASPEIAWLVELRRQILSGKVDDSFLKSIAASSPNKLWRGEIFLLLAAAYESLGKFQPAYEFHQKAATELLKIGAKGKCLRARSNMVANLSNIDPERKLIPEYLYILRDAKKLRQYNVMATVLLNLSREYQRMGALTVALRHCNRAIAACKADLGGQIHFLAIAHRAHLLLELGRFIDAKADFELAATSDFPIVKSACAVLAVALEGGGPDLDDAPILRTWRERLSEFTDKKTAKKLKLSALEEKLVQFLSEKPRGKFEITDFLFGPELHPLTAENRLKNLIHRIRRKVPGLIVHEKDEYSLAVRDLPKKTKAG